MELKILFEDNHVVVVFKPQNVEFLEFTEWVKHYLVDKGHNSSMYLQALYALDKCMGGVVVYCLTSKAYQRCQKQVSDDECEMNFYAVCLTKNNVEFGGYCEYAEYVSDTGMRRVPELNKNANKIIFNYRKLDVVKDISLYKISTSKAMRNTIRFGLFDLGVPVFGDNDYGGDKLVKDTNVALYLVDFAFWHPVSKERLRFRCLPPIDNKPWSYFDMAKFLRIAR